MKSWVKGPRAWALLAALGSLGFGKEITLPPAHTFVEDDGAVKRGLADELTRSMKDLKLGDSPRPYYLSYALSDVGQATATATFGALTGAVAYRGRTLRTDVRVGTPKFDNSNTSESLFSANIESLPVDDDYAAFRRELWLRTDEAYKTAVETLAKKQSAAAGQVTDEDDGDLPDFSSEKAAQVVIPFAAAVPDPGSFIDTVTRLSALLKAFPEVSGTRVTATYATVRRRFASSENAWADETQATMRVDVVAETQAADGMRLVNFVTFTALDPAGLPPFAEMQQAVERMARELTAMRTAPIVPSGVASVLFEGPAAAQLAKLLIADNVGGTPAPRTAGGGEERSQSSEFADRLGQKVAAPLLMAVDDPTKAVSGKTSLFGAYHVDDEGVPAARVPLIDGGILKGLLMTRIPRKEIAHSNGHARATRFSAPRAAVGNLFLSGKPGAPRVGLSRAALLAEMRRAGRGGGLASYVIRLLDDPQIPGVANPADAMSMISISGSGRTAPSVKPLCAWRVTADGKEELVRGLTLEGIVPRSLKDIVAVGKDLDVYNFQEGGLGFVGVPSSIITPPLLLSDVDIRRAVGKHKRPPLYPRPSL
ncbi:MAG TPA: metallopeptidase TldD-related protein [Polyangia bacterium]|jgi:predicted Zn-dependent protease